jgi:hypothetical protein
MKLILYIFLIVNGTFSNPGGWSLRGNNQFYARDIDDSEWDSFKIKPSNQTKICYYLNLFC